MSDASSAPNAEVQDANLTDSSTVDMQDANAATSSGAGDTEVETGPKSMLDAVLAAADPEEGTGGEATAPKNGSGEPSSSEQSNDELDEEEEKKLPFHQHWRWKQKNELLKARESEIDTLKAQLEQYKDFDTLKQSHEALQSITNYVGKAGFTNDTFSNLLQMGVAIQNAFNGVGDPNAALNSLLPYVNHLQQLAGHVLPDDLQQRVREGLMDQQSAYELSQQRARAQFAQNNAQHWQSQHQQFQQEQQVAQTRNDVYSSVSGWEQQWASTDPDYAALQPRVMERIELELLRRQQAGQPLRNSQEAVAIAEQAKKDVLTELSRFRPQKPAISPPVTGRGGAGSQSTPNSMLEAIQRAAGGGY